MHLFIIHDSININSFLHELKIQIYLDKNNLELDVDIAGDLAALKDNLAKFKKGKMKGLEDIDINELDWVRN